MNTKVARLTLFSAGLLILMAGVLANYLVSKTLDGLTAKEQRAREFYEWVRRDVVQQFAIEEADWDGVTLVISGWLEKRECVLASSNPYEVIDWYVELDGGSRIRVEYEFNPANDRHISRPPGTTSFQGWELVLTGEPPDGSHIVAFAQHNCAGVVIGPREFARFTLMEALAGGFIWQSEDYNAEAPI